MRGKRLKSLADRCDKKMAIKIIPDATASELSLRARLEEGATELTSIGCSR